MNNTKKLTGLRGWIARLARQHEGRSWVRLVIYLITLLILAPVSLALELLCALLAFAAEWINDLGRPLQKWAEFRKSEHPPTE